MNTRITNFEYIEHLESIGQKRRNEVAKQMIFDCAMELQYRTEDLTRDQLCGKLLDALNILEWED